VPRTGGRSSPKRIEQRLAAAHTTARGSASNPVSFWHLDESSTSQPASDAQGLHPGSYVGGPALGGAGVVGTAMNIPDASMTVPNSPDFNDSTGTFSIEMWVKPSGPGGTYGSYRSLACNTVFPSMGWLLATDVGGGLIFQNGDGGSGRGYAKTATSLVNGAWNQVVAEFDHGTLRL